MIDKPTVLHGYLSKFCPCIRAKYRPKSSDPRAPIYGCNSQPSQVVWTIFICSSDYVDMTHHHCSALEQHQEEKEESCSCSLLSLESDTYTFIVDLYWSNIFKVALRGRVPRAVHVFSMRRRGGDLATVFHLKHSSLQTSMSWILS